jgi:REP element-mobilizing transposase RayT
MAAILKDFGCPPLQVGGWEDHTHSLFQLGRTRCLADVVKKLKTGTTTWMKGRWPGMDGFSWQIGYGGLPVGGSEVQRIRRYIERQDEHHFKVSFQDEYRALLREAGIDFDENYLWD